MFRPLGSFTPTAVLTDIYLFFDKDQLHPFSLASPRTNGLFKSSRKLAYKKIEIHALKNNKISIVLQDSIIDDTKREIYIDTDKENITEKMAILLSTCHSIDEFRWNGDRYTKWNYFTFNEKLIELMLKIEIKKMLLCDCSILVSLPLFVNFLYRHGNILILEFAKLPSELVSNKTLKLISKFDILPMEGTALVVDVTDELLKRNITSCGISGFLTKFTVRGIYAFVRKISYRSWKPWNTSFGILDSDQMQNALAFERGRHPNEYNRIDLLSNNGQKMLKVNVLIGMYNSVTLSIVLNTTDTDQSGMVSIPNNLFGIVAQESFLKFNKIFSKPEELLPISQYQMESLSIDYFYCVDICYTIRGENRKIIIERTDVTLKDAQKIIVEILRNCTFIDRLNISRIKLDEDFYHLLKPIADKIHVPEWCIESALEPESLREVQAANSGLFAKINLIF